MKLHQLRYLAAVAQSGLNITAAAQKLHTSQPGVSKQIKLLEDELGFRERSEKSKRFFRQGKTGGWRDVLTRQQVERIVAAHEPQMRRFGYWPVKDWPAEAPPERALA